MSGQAKCAKQSACTALPGHSVLDPMKLLHLPVLLPLFLSACGGGTTESVQAGGPSLEQLVAEERVDDVVALLEPKRASGSLEPVEAAYLARARVAQGEIPKGGQRSIENL